MPVASKAILFVMAGLAAVVIFGAYLKSHRMLRYLLLSVVSGLAALYAVNALGLLTGLRVPINALSLGVSAAAGPPGVVGLLLFHTFF